MSQLTAEYVKKEYNRQIKEDYKNNYEHKRWFSTPESRLGYVMHKASQRQHTKDIKFGNYLEFGVGPGTWTKMFLNKNGNFTLVDISKEMLKLAKENLSKNKNIKFIVGNILNLKSKNKYDFVFSSRAIKYIPKKEKLFKIIYSSMKEAGSCVIINQSCDTIMQRIDRLFRVKSKETLHQGGITIKDLKQILIKAGFRDIELFPVEIKVGIPGLIIFKQVSQLIWKLFYKYELNWLSTLLSGSYLIRMKK
ncbi:MAG: class I SAM-dependent methyltransferase [Nanoarchaeota archaeon]